MKFLIIGACGMAGHMVAMYLQKQGHEVIGFARKKSPVCETIVGNAFDKNVVREAVFSKNYDAVINCIGILNDAVDSNLPNGIYLNSILPHEISDYCKERKTMFIHLSSDCVFSGKHGGYIESDTPDEISYYGRTKWLGEVIGENELTLRTSIIGPEIKTDGVGLFHWFMKQRGIVNGYANVIWSGVTTLVLAKAIEVAAKQKLNGLYHLCNNDKISKYELLQLFNNYCKENQIEVNPEYMPVSDKSIICTRDDFDFCVPTYEDMVKEMSMWIKENEKIYAQYRGL